MSKPNFFVDPEHAARAMANSLGARKRNGSSDHWLAFREVHDLGQSKGQQVVADRSCNGGGMQEGF